MYACKVSGPNRTKMFRVKHFGTIFTPNKTFRLRRWLCETSRQV